jgi:DNA-directed RNA polymerase subunit K/omega
MRELKNLDELAKVAQNRYEAVIVASKRARILNAKRQKENEQNPDLGVAGGMHRIAEQALDELLQGKIEVKR